MRRRAPRAVCAAVGRCSEKWRFKVEGGHQARLRSLREGGLERPSVESENVDPSRPLSPIDPSQLGVHHVSPVGGQAGLASSCVLGATCTSPGLQGDPYKELMGQHGDPYVEHVGLHEGPFISKGQHGDPH
eukprot:5012195-Pyramimonas_sp.AAC.1